MANKPKYEGRDLTNPSQRKYHAIEIVVDQFKVKLEEAIAQAKQAPRGVSLWIEIPPVKMYIRMPKVFLGGVWHTGIQIANVEVAIPTTGKGYFTGLLDMMEKVATDHKFELVYVENVLNPRFGYYLTRRNYIEAGRTDPPCYFKYVSLAGNA